MPHAARVVPGLEGSVFVQADLVDTLVAEGRRRPGVGPSLAFASFSQCGACILLRQAARAEADALLSLDGWVGWADGAALLRDSVSLEPDSIRAPYGYLGEDPRVVTESESPDAWDHSLVHALTLREGGFLAYLRALRHADFTTAGVLEFGAPGYSTSVNWQGPVRVGSVGHAHAVLWSALRFLDVHLRGNQVAGRTLCAAPGREGLDDADILIRASGLCGVRSTEVLFR